MNFPYKKIAVFGATSGIGEALAERFVTDGIFVVVIGRRKERLDAFVDKHGSDKAESSVFDVTNMNRISTYTGDLINKHPDLDLVFLNSGIQRPLDFSKPESVDMDVIQEEIITNYTSQVALTQAFLPYLMSRGRNGQQAGIMYTTSALGLVPKPSVSNYSATKAAMHSFILTLREQIKSSGVKVLEILPPAVQTELHGEEGKHIGMPLKDFTDEAWDKLRQGRDQIPVGMGMLAWDAFEEKRQEVFHARFGTPQNST